jgi:diguanylate cyclase (GGDEF)-like protein
MTSQQAGAIWEFISHIGLPILCVFLLACLIGELVRIQRLSSKLRRFDERAIVMRTQLQEAQVQQDAQLEQVKTLQAEMNHLEQTRSVMTDEITGLPNYHAVMSRVDAELSRCIRTQISCAILFVHLDSFKRINDTWGEEAGDTILLEASSRLLRNVRAEDFLGHYERGNFALLLVETDLAGAIRAAERLRLEIGSSPYSWSMEEIGPPTTLEITASIGVAVYGLHGTTRDVLMQHSVSAMLRARKDGRNRVRVADIDEVQPGSAIMKELVSDEEATINALTAATSAHHQDMSKHAYRLVTLAEETAKEIGCSEQEVHVIHLSALLHDVGKLGIPDAILDKPGPLTEEEWEVMRLHPQIGQRILSQAGGIFATLAHVIVAHHERWDGKGYPLGLSQHNIPIEARILSVVDSFDAMTSTRTYREPSSIEEARNELLRCAGSQFDPEIVIAFLRVLSRSTYTSEAQSEDVFSPQVVEQSSIPIA